MTVTNLADRRIDRLFEESQSLIMDFYLYLNNYGEEHKASLDTDLKFKFTFDSSVIMSRLLFCVSYFMAYRAYNNKEIPLERLTKFMDEIGEVPCAYAGEALPLVEYKKMTDTLYNSAMKHRGTI